MFRLLLCLPLVLLPLLTCAQQLPDQTTEEILIDSSKERLQRLLDGHYQDFVDWYSPDFTDLGGGMNGDGSVDLSQLPPKLEKFLTSDRFDGWEKKVEVLFDWSQAEVLDYDKIKAEKGDYTRFSYTLTPGDYMLRVPPTEGSPFFDGWFAILRMQAGEWKVVAGD